MSATNPRKSSGKSSGAAKSTRKGGSSRRSRDDGPPNLVGAYMRDVATVSMLTPEQEQSLANSIASRRVVYWSALLALPRLVAPSTQYLRQALEKRNIDEEKLPTEAIEALEHAVQALAQSDDAPQRERFDSARQALCEQMGELDLDGDLSDGLCGELQKLAASNDSKCALQLEVRPEPALLKPYLSQIRNAQHHLNSAKNHFVRANLRLVISIARRFDHGLMPLQDIIQEGNIGLMKAVDRFDARLGFRFSTYASWWIRHAINRALANKGRTVRLPAHVSADLQRLGRARREIEAKTGNKASPQELAKHTELTLTRVQKLLRLALEPTVSLDSPVGHEDARGLIDLLVDMQAEMPGDKLEQRSVQSHLREAMARLAPIEVDILCKRYGINSDDDFEPMTLRQLGELHSLSRERIRQLQERALHKLRLEFNRRDILVA